MPPTASDQSSTQSSNSWRTLSLHAYKTLANNFPSFQKHKEAKTAREEEDRGRKYSETVAAWREIERSAENREKARQWSMITKMR